jgi:hypothetical protein
MMNRALMIAAVYGKTRLSLQEVCRELNISYGTGRQWRSQGKFPVPMTGTPLAADVTDIAAYFDSLKEETHDA